MEDYLDEAFAPGELEVGALTSAQRDRIMQEGLDLGADSLDSRDEVLRWRRFLRVLNDWRQCSACGLWTERNPGDPCKSCDFSPDADAPADFLIRTEGTISLLAPLTERARAWVDENISEHREYAGNIVINHADVHEILVEIIDDELSIV